MLELSHFLGFHKSKKIWAESRTPLFAQMYGPPLLSEKIVIYSLNILFLKAKLTRSGA